MESNRSNYAPSFKVSDLVPVPLQEPQAGIADATGPLDVVGGRLTPSTIDG